jgi:hypothetical protein
VRGVGRLRENTPFLLHGRPDVVDRRFELLRRQNDERNRRMLQVIARSMPRPISHKPLNS